MKMMDSVGYIYTQISTGDMKSNDVAVTSIKHF